MDDIVPDVVDEAPTGELQVIYPGNVFVKMGNELTPTQVKDEPQVTWPYVANEDGSTLYTCLMVDPDAPSRKDPSLSEILHWAIINIPGHDLAVGQVLAEYIGSGPPEGSGLHRYIFLLYRQEAMIEEELYITNNIREGRLNFSTRKFTATHHLGTPIAGNFYLAQYDDYVPIRNQQFIG